MRAYLLTWNPAKSPNDYLVRTASELRRDQVVEDDWSCGNNKHIEVGDRVFLLRQGNDLPGIMASGWVTKGSFSARSWEAAKRRKGIKAWYVELEWEKLVIPEKGLSRAQLVGSILPATLLKSAASGVRVPPELTERLERRWSAHLKEPLRASRLVLGTSSGQEGEPIEHRGYRRKRDQRLRRAALDASAGVCEVCGVDYSRVLNGNGVRVLQVHHKKQLGYTDKPRLTKVTDLAVLCSNCHALIHLNPKKAMKVEALKVLLKKERA
jgi:hypothetical protein